MPPNPEPLYLSVSNTLAPDNPSERGKEIVSIPDEGDATSYLLSPSIHRPLDIKGNPFRKRTNDIFLLAGMFIMLVWPWIFLTIVWARKGLQTPDQVAKAVKNHPQATSFFVTLLGNIVSMIVSILFSIAVVRFAREWITNNDHVTVFDVSLISVFRYQNWPWNMKDYKYLLVRNRWLPVVLAGVCIAAFPLVPSGTTSLLAPDSFYRTVLLNGTELNFASNATDCVDWFEGHRAYYDTTICGWKENGLRYSDCPGMDVLLEAGRNNIIHSVFSDNSESVVLAQLGPNSSLHFLGPVRGVLPIDPNGLPSRLDPFNSSQLSEAQKKATLLSYNYTLERQGLASNINCSYDTKSPIVVSTSDNTGLVHVNASCDGIGLDAVQNMNMRPGPDGFSMPKGQYTLTFWACKSILNASGEQDPAYYIYLRGLDDQAGADENITCTISPIQPALFPVAYQSSTGVFSTQKQSATFQLTDHFSELIEIAILWWGKLVFQGQNSYSNTVADLVRSLGLYHLGLPPYDRNKQQLPLYAAMIQGTLVDQVTYMRFLYSYNVSAPPSCMRTVNGTLTTNVIGWVAKPVHIGFLMPMTILNLASLIMVIISISRAKVGCYEFDPTDPRSLLLANPRLDESEPTGWADVVSYCSRERLREEHSEWARGSTTQSDLAS